MKWPWVRRAALDDAERAIREGQEAILERGYLQGIASQLRAELAAERSLTADLFVRIADLERRPAVEPDALPPAVLAALNERAPMRGNRHLRAMLERDARAMLREGTLRDNPDVVAAMILSGDRVE